MLMAVMAWQTKQTKTPFTWLDIESLLSNHILIGCMHTTNWDELGFFYRHDKCESPSNRQGPRHWLDNAAADYNVYLFHYRWNEPCIKCQPHLLAWKTTMIRGMQTLQGLYARDQLIKDTKMYKVKNKIPVVQARIGRAGIFPVAPVLWLLVVSFPPNRSIISYSHRPVQ